MLVVVCTHAPTEQFICIIGRKGTCVRVRQRYVFDVPGTLYRHIHTSLPRSSLNSLNVTICQKRAESSSERVNALSPLPQPPSVRRPHVLQRVARSPKYLHMHTTPQLSAVHC